MKLLPLIEDAIKKPVFGCQMCGQELTVVGTIYEESWTDKTGTNRTSYEVNARSIGVTTYSISKESAKDRFFDEVETPF